MTAREKVLRLLRDAGPRGVTTGEFAAAYQPRAAARMHELRERGYVIDSICERPGSYRFTLIAEPEEPAKPSPPSEPAPEPAALFDPPPAPSRPGYLDPDMEEAA